jgi:hypothetical protein
VRVFFPGGESDISGFSVLADDSGSGPKPKKAPGKVDFLGFCFGLMGSLRLF